MRGDFSEFILRRDYLKKDEFGEPIESIEDMFHRVAHAIAKVDALYGHEDYAELEQAFYEMMSQSDFLPNTPTLINAGLDNGQLSACFVLPIEDSLTSIYQTLADAALIQKSGGGTGFSFSKLRHQGSRIASSGGATSGPVSFIKVFDASTSVIKQGGVRRGANIAILDITHPDIQEFISCKEDQSSLQNFNISVGITEEFLKACTEGEEVELIDPANQMVVKKVPASALLDKISENAHRHGEPGVVFFDNIEKSNPFHRFERIEATNPCGEQPLLPYESCNLGSINLVNMCQQSADGTWDFDWKKIEYIVGNAVHFLDNVIDANHYPLPSIEEKTKASRKIGLGVMGWADALFVLGIPYNSETAIELAKKLMRFIYQKADKSSRALAEERGAFPRIGESNVSERRNATLLTIAPTGTLSIIAECSTGIEPLYALSFLKKLSDGNEVRITNAHLIKLLSEQGILDEDLRKAIEREGNLSLFEDVPCDIRKVFVTALEIPYEYHVKMQAAFQESVDNAVSKTVNLSHAATVEDVKNCFLLAHQLGCKGITIYRDGSRSSQVLSTGTEVTRPHYNSITPSVRPDTLRGVTEKVKSGCGDLYITTNSSSLGACEVFTNTGGGGCHAQSEAIARLISIGLRCGVKKSVIEKQLNQIVCPNAVKVTNGKVRSCPSAIAQAISRSDDAEKESYEVPLCTCGGKLVFEDGCFMCPNCGLTNCR